jgi:hypothetical protein
MPNAPEILNPVIHHISQAQLAKYADASGDDNPLHLDEVRSNDTIRTDDRPRDAIACVRVRSDDQSLRPHLALRGQDEGKIPRTSVPRRYRHHHGHAKIHDRHHGNVPNRGAQPRWCGRSYCGHDGTDLLFLMEKRSVPVR